MRGKAVTQETFNAVHTMLKAGVKQKYICEILGYSYCTINWLANSESFENYKKISDEHIRKMKARQAAKAAAAKAVPVETKEEMSLTDKVRKAIGLYGREAREEQAKKEAKKKSVLIMITVDEYNEQLIAPTIAVLSASFGSKNVITDASDNK